MDKKYIKYFIERPKNVIYQRSLSLRKNPINGAQIKPTGNVR